jgi:hypothetical protein
VLASLVANVEVSSDRAAHIEKSSTIATRAIGSLKTARSITLLVIQEVTLYRSFVLSSSTLDSLPTTLQTYFSAQLVLAMRVENRGNEYLPMLGRDLHESGIIGYNETTRLQGSMRLFIKINSIT